MHAISIGRLNLPEVVGMFSRGRIREYPSSEAPLEPASEHESWDPRPPEKRHRLVSFDNNATLFPQRTDLFHSLPIPLWWSDSKHLAKRLSMNCQSRQHHLSLDGSSSCRSLSNTHTAYRQSVLWNER